MKVITLEWNGDFIQERERLIAEGAIAPPIFSTQEEDRDEDKKVYITMEMFLKKKRHWDFWAVIDMDGTLLGISNYLFIK